MYSYIHIEVSTDIEIFAEISLFSTRYLFRRSNSFQTFFSVGSQFAKYLHADICMLTKRKERKTLSAIE